MKRTPLQSRQRSPKKIRLLMCRWLLKNGIQPVSVALRLYIQSYAVQLQFIGVFEHEFQCMLTGFGLQ